LETFGRPCGGVRRPAPSSRGTGRTFCILTGSLGPLVYRRTAPGSQYHSVLDACPSSNSVRRRHRHGIIMSLGAWRQPPNWTSVRFPDNRTTFTRMPTPTGFVTTPELEPGDRFEVEPIGATGRLSLPRVLGPDGFPIEQIEDPAGHPLDLRIDPATS